MFRKKLLFSSLCLGLLAAPVWAESTVSSTTRQLAVGDPTPAFSNPDQSGSTVSNQTIAGHWTVLYFYPKDDTPGCTVEAKTYTTLLKQYQSLGAHVYGISLQDTESHNAFREKHKLEVPLLVDTDGKTAQAFGVDIRDGEFASRDTIVIDPNGQIAKIDRSVDPEAHPRSLLAWLTEQIKSQTQ